MRDADRDTLGEVDVLHSLAARYCIRQDARGFIALWALIVALASATLGLFFAARRRVADRRDRFAAFAFAGALGCLTVLTAAFGLTIFRWCYESAAASLGMTSASPTGKQIDSLICLSPHAVELIGSWILAIVSLVAALALLLVGVFRLRKPLQKALTFGGAAAALLFAMVNVGFMLFSISWCQSPRLF